MTCEPIFRFIPFSSEGGTRLREEHGEVRQRAGNQGTGRSGLCVQVTGTVAAPRCLRSSSNGVRGFSWHQSCCSQGAMWYLARTGQPGLTEGPLPVTPWLVERSHSPGSQSCHYSALAWEKERSCVLACHTQVTGSTNTVRHTQQCESTSALTMLGTKAVTPLTQPLPPPTHAAICRSSSPTAFLSAQCVNNYLSGLCL